MLKKKEKQILELRKRGFKQSEIASKLKICQPAVSSFVNNNFWLKLDHVLFFIQIYRKVYI